jgi:Tol biopolymer transport system component
MSRSHNTLAAVVVVAGLGWTVSLLGQARPDVALRAAIELEEVKGDVKSAMEQYRKLAEAGDRTVAAQALLRLAKAYQALGDAQARPVYERLVRDFRDQREVVADAETRLSALASASTRGVQTARRLSTSGGWGRLSRDGRYLAQGQCCNTGDLAIRDLVTNTERRLTNTGGWVKSGDYATEPVISPDNRFVAYEWFIEAGGMTELRVLPMAGQTAEPRVLIRTEQRYIRPIDWTPDGTRLLVFRGEPGDWHIGIVNVSDGRYARLKSFEWRNPGSTELSPDGRFVTYAIESEDTGSPHDIVVLAMDGSRESIVVAGPEDDTAPFWSADSGHLLFLREHAGRTGLWAVSMRDGGAAGTPFLVKEDMEGMRPLGVTRDGALYYAVAGGLRQNVYVAPLKDFVAAGPPVLVNGLSVDASGGASWSPDGTQLTYWAARPRTALVLRSMTSGEERAIPLPPGATGTATPQFFPDGRSILIHMRTAQGGQAFARFDIDNGTVDTLHQSPLTNAEVVSVALAPNGAAIYWAVQSTNRSGVIASPSGRLMRVDLKTREEQELKRDEWYLALALSPDGQELAYLKNTRTERDKGEAPGILEVMPAAGGPSRQVFRAPIWYSGTRYNTLAWAPDQRSLLAVQDDLVLWRIPLDGTAPRHMGLAGTEDFSPGGKPFVDERMIRSPRIHPDGKHIALTVREELPSELWRLDNFIPTTSARR